MKTNMDYKPLTIEDLQSLIDKLQNAPKPKDLTITKLLVSEVDYNKLKETIDEDVLNTLYCIKKYD